MPIQLITGVPGAGKTLLALETVLSEVGVKDRSSVAAIRQGLASATRPLVVCGVEGLVPGTFHEIEDPMEWQALEDGSLVLVDEAWKWWGAQLANSISRDARYLALAEHRHRGFDFILTTQASSQLHPHLKALVGGHRHVARKFGTATSVVWSWPDVQSSPNSEASKNRALDKVWTQPKPLFQLYQSATLHTIKRKIPGKLIAAVLALPVIAGVVVFAGRAATSIGDGADSLMGPTAATVSEGAALGTGRDGPSYTPETWAARFKPRIAYQPMSAPAYDDREVVAEPRVFCVLSGAGVDAMGTQRPETCNCITEQATDYVLPDATCRFLVLKGPAYDPFREPLRDVPARQHQDDRQQAPRPASVDEGPVGLSAEPASYGDFRPSDRVGL